MTVWRFFGLAILLMALLFAILISFASTWLRLGLSVYDIEDVAFTSLNIGLSKTELTGLKIGDPVSQEVDAISVDYSLSMLMGGRVDRIRVTGLRADLDLDEILQDELATADDSPPALSPLSALADELIVEQSRINLDTPFGIVTIPFSGHIETQEERIEFQVMSDQADREEAHGDISIVLDLVGTMPLSEPPALNLIEASGDVSIQIVDASLPKLGEDLDGGGQIAIAIKDGKLEASSEALNFAIQHPITGEPLDGPLTATAGSAGKPFLVTGQQDGDLWHLDVKGPLDVTAAPGQGLADIDVQLSLDHQGKLQHLKEGKVDVDFKDLSAHQASLSAASINLEIKGEADATDGRLTLALEGFDWSNDQYRLQDLTLDQTLAVRIENEALMLLIEEQGRASIGQVAAIDQVESGWFTVRFHQDEAPIVRLDTKNGDWQSQLHLEIDPARIETPSGQWWARVEDLDLSASGDRSGIKSGKIAIEKGRADWPGSNLALAGIESELHLTENGALSNDTIPIAIRSIRPLEEPKLFSPFRLDAELSPSAKPSTAKGQLISRATPDVAIAFSGTYDQRNDNAAFTFDLPDLRFSETGLQPSNLSPALLDVVEETSGRMALTGRIDWDAGELSSSMDLLIEELGLSIGPARLERVNTLFHFDSLIPPTTPADQELAIALLDVGLPLTDGLVSMQLRPDGEFAVDQLSWRLADGDVKAAPFTFGSDVQDLTMVLDVDQLDLDKLLELTRLDGLSGDGRIDGTLPLTISENGVIVADGKLEATDAGILRYRPDEPPSALTAGGESIGLVLQALEDFHYDDLDISLDGRTDGETDIKLHIKGANPDLYDGHPIEFNLDLEGDLANLIRANLSNYQIPDRIRERLQGFGQ